MAGSPFGTSRPPGACPGTRALRLPALPLEPGAETDLARGLVARLQHAAPEGGLAEVRVGSAEAQLRPIVVGARLLAVEQVEGVRHQDHAAAGQGDAVVGVEIEGRLHRRAAAEAVDG